MVGEPVPSNNKTTVYEGESKGRPAGGRVKSAVKAQRYGPIWVWRWLTGGLALAARPAVWCGTANLTGRHCQSSDCSGILFEKKIQRKARFPGGSGSFPKEAREKSIILP
jgi:hypothetical protein